MIDSAGQSRNLALLGILLQSFYVLFGITAVIGVLISHSKLSSTIGTIYHSQLRWQIITFWTGLLVYAVSIYLWLTQSITWPIVLAFVFVLYRLVVSVFYWRQTRAIDRLI